MPLRIHGTVARPRVRTTDEFTARVALAALQHEGLGELADSLLDRLLRGRRKGR